MRRDEELSDIGQNQLAFFVLVSLDDTKTTTQSSPSYYQIQPFTRFILLLPSSFPIELECTTSELQMKERGGAVGDATPSQAEALAWKTPVANAIPGSSALETQAKAWNTRNLGLRIGTDALAAASAGVLVAPIITIIDRYDTALQGVGLHILTEHRGIIENASGTTTLGTSVRSSLKTLFLRPHSFFFSKPFGLIFV